MLRCYISLHERLHFELSSQSNSYLLKTLPLRPDPPCRNFLLLAQALLNLSLSFSQSSSPTHLHPHNTAYRNLPLTTSLSYTNFIPPRWPPTDSSTCSWVSPALLSRFGVSCPSYSTGKHYSRKSETRAKTELRIRSAAVCYGSYP